MEINVKWGVSYTSVSAKFDLSDLYCENEAE